MAPYKTIDTSSKFLPVAQPLALPSGPCKEPSCARVRLSAVRERRPFMEATRTRCILTLSSFGRTISLLGTFNPAVESEVCDDRLRLSRQSSYLSGIE